MTTAQRTPGSWKILARNRNLPHGRGPGYDVQQDCPDGLGEIICEKATEADARLIASAPKLYEIVSFLADREVHDDPLIQDALALMLKLEGGD